MAWTYSNKTTFATGTTAVGSSGSLGGSSIGGTTGIVELRNVGWTGAANFTTLSSYASIQSSTNSNPSPALKGFVQIRSPNTGAGPSQAYTTGGSTYQWFGITYAGHDPAFTNAGLLDSTPQVYASGTSGGIANFNWPTTTQPNSLVLALVMTNNPSAGTITISNPAMSAADGVSSSISTANPSSSSLLCRGYNAGATTQMALFDMTYAASQGSWGGYISLSGGDAQVVIITFALKGLADAGSSSNMFFMF